MSTLNIDTFKKKVCTYQQTGCGDCKHSLCCPEDAPTIIEADKESEETGWIPVSKRLPEDSELVLFSTKTGRWIDTEFTKLKECSICHARWGIYSIEQFDFCPSCGAKMIEPQESEE